MLGYINALGESDCEEITSEALAQPVNSISSFAFSIVGLVVIYWARSVAGIERELRLAFGAILVLTGFGSYLFHGPQPPVSQFAHDITFLAAIALIVIANLAAGLSWSRQRLWVLFSIVLLVESGVLILAPGATNTLMVMGVVLWVASHFVLARLGGISVKLLASSLLAMALAVAFFALGREGGPICDPDSLFQGHAVWHVLSAVGIGTYFAATSPPRIASLGTAL
ncbi:MAG: hypothetical protein ACR2N7_05625 [Acidimicrobiia bacterium]